MENELTFSEVIDNSRSYIKHCFANKWMFIILSGIGVIYAFINYQLQKTYYNSSLTFMVKEDEGNSLVSGAISSILGNIGFGSGAKSKVNLDKVVALSKSKYIIKNALLDTIFVKGKNEMLALYLIDVYNLKESWKKEKGIISTFDGFRSNKEMSLVENDALENLYGMIADPQNTDKMFSSSYDDKSTIISLKFKSISDTLSYSMINSIYKHLQSFYIRQSIEKAEKTVHSLEEKLINISKNLKNKDYAYAQKIDNNLGVWLKQETVDQDRTLRDVQINSILYSEVIKNLETARFSLNSATPVFQAIDEPCYPVSKSEPSLLKYIFVGFSIGILMALLCVFLKVKYKVSKVNL